MEDKTKSYFLNDFVSIIQSEDAVTGWNDSYGKNIILFETKNTAETRQMISKIDATTKVQNFNSSGELSTELESKYSNTDYSGSDLILRMIIQTKGE